MRENLFRGRKEGSQEWVYGYLAAYDLIFPRYPEDVSNALGEYYRETPYVGFVEVDPATVGQYIGATDKFQKKLFDGNLVVTKFGRVCLVIWHSGAHCWALLPVGRLNCKVPDRDDLWASENLEKIGNRWDNPELLEATSI